MAGMTGNKIPLQSEVKGIDVVTGEPATTGGPYASPNPVKPFGDPRAEEAMQRNKTGSYVVAGSKEKLGALEESKANERKRADEAAAKANDARAKAEHKAPPLYQGTGLPERTVTPAVPEAAVPNTPGVKAATGAPSQPSTPPKPAQIKVPTGQSMAKPTVSTQHVPTATTPAPHAVTPGVKLEEQTHETGDSSKDEGASSEGAEGQAK